MRVRWIGFVVDLEYELTSSVGLELLVPHLSILATEAQQLCVRASLDDRALLEHDDLVGVDDGREAMRDDERRAALGDLVQGRLNAMLGLGVERRRGLVEHHDGRVLEDRARDSDALLLAATEAQSAFADLGLVSVGKAQDKVVDLRHTRSFVHFFVGRIDAAVLDVVRDRIVEEHRVLRNDADTTTQRGLRHGSNIDIVDRDATRNYGVEAEE